MRLKVSAIRSSILNNGFLVRPGILAVWLMAMLANGAAAQDPYDVTHAVGDGGMLETILFYIVAATAVASGLGICISKSVVRMAVWLFVALGSVALLYFLLAATFLGAIQLIVYAGGTLVLLIFGVMLTSKSPWVRFDISGREMIAAGLVCVIIGVSFITLLARAFSGQPTPAVAGVSVYDLGIALLSTYLVPFEVASVLLLVVMIGAAYLARQERT